MTQQITQRPKLGQKRCAYPQCNKILEFTVRKNAEYCNSFCGNADRKRKQLEHLKQCTLLKQEAKIVFDNWTQSGIPIYKLTALDQARIKFHILNKKEKKIWTKPRRREWDRNYYHTVKKKKNVRNSERYFILPQRKFAKFWNRIENIA